jgi:ribosomal protein S18 acetylase RimI-like enzyme
MSEFYALRRNAITDLSAFFGFLIGFLGSSPFAWPYLQVGFQTQEIVKGFAWFIGITFGSGVALGVTGLGVGRLLGSVWEGGHKVMRRARGQEFAMAGSPSPTPAAFPDQVIRTQASRAATDVPVPSARIAAGVDASEFGQLMSRSGLPAPDVVRLREAMGRTINVGAWDDQRLVGAVRLLTDGYEWTVVTDILVDPAYRRRGIGTALMRRAADRAVGKLAVAQIPPGTEGFFRRLDAIPAYEGFVRGAKGRLA